MTPVPEPAATTYVRGLLDAQAADLAEHLRRLGPLPGLTADQLLQVVHDSGLTGRGGAAFASARKLAAVAQRGRVVVVANGAEGEPASSKDRLLLARSPHLVLDGLVLAARAVGAGTAYVYAPKDLLDGPVAQALAERRDDVHVRSVAAPDSFVSGQESAAVSTINGGRALPTSMLPPVYERGVGGRPTLVHNVETLAQLALAVRFGSQWFRAGGTTAEPGTRLFTVSGAVRTPGVVELPGGSPLGAIVDAAGGPAAPLQALLVGGYHGGWVPWDARTADLPCSKGDLTRFEAAPGAGVVVALAADRCGLAAGADIAAYLAGESAGQCGPCHNGLPAAAGLLHTVAYGRPSPRMVSELERVVGLVDGRGACHHPGGTARLVRSTLRTFAADVSHHLGDRCAAGLPTKGRS